MYLSCAQNSVEPQVLSSQHRNPKGLVRSVTAFFAGVLAGCSPAHENELGPSPKPAGALAESAESVGSVSQALTPYSVMSDSQKRSKLLAMIANYVPVAQSVWREPSDISQSTGYYEANGDGVKQPRGEAGIAYAFATLLYARPDSVTSFPGVSRVDLEGHLREAIRHLAYTNEFCRPSGSAPLPSARWGGTIDDPHDQGSIVAFQMGWAAHVLDLIHQRRGTRLDRETRDAVQCAVTRQANELVRLVEANVPTLPAPFTPTNADTRAEENAWHSSVLALAAAIYDPHPDNAAWDNQAKNFSINASSRAADEADGTVIDGKPVSTWVTTVNLDDDFTLTNHGFFHPVYSQGIFQNMMDNAVFYRVAGAAVPSAFSFRMQEVWQNLLGYLAWSDGDIIAPAGTDWVTHDYQHIPYLATIATRLGRNDASVLESRAISRLETRQTAEGGAFFGHSEIGYETDIFRNLAHAWWIHSQFGPSPVPTEAQFRAAAGEWDGIKHWEGNRRKVVALRGRNAVASMSWMDENSTHPTALIVPSSENHLEDPVLIQHWPRSGPGAAIGPANYSCTDLDLTRPQCGSSLGFSTAGEIESTPKRFFSMTAWADGPVIWLDRGTGATFVMAFESAAGLAGPRAVHAASGQQAEGSFSGDWFNVANRIGVIARGGQGFFLEDFSDTSSHRNITNPHRRLELSSDSVVRSRGAFVLPGKTAQETAVLNPDADLSTVTDSGWTALSARAPDGTGRMAVARWSTGGATATVRFTGPRGAPIPDRPNDVTVTGSTGATSFTLSANQSAGFKAYFWVNATSAVTVRPISETRARITNGASSSVVTVHFVDGAGRLHSAERAFSANQVAFAHFVDEGLAIVLPSATTVASGRDPAQAYDGITSSGYWSSTPQNLGTSAQELRLDFGKLVDMGGLTMTPRANQGPRNYEVQVSDTGSSGTYTTPSGGSVTDASATSATTTRFSSAVRARYVRLRITSAWGSGPPHSVAVSELSLVPPERDLDSVDPLLGSATLPEMRLARGGVNRATIRVRNGGASAASITVNASVPAPMTISGVPTTVSVPAGGFTDVEVTVRGSGTAPSSGSSTMTVTANGAAAESIRLLHTDNLALNDLGVTFPKAVSATEDPAYVYPPRLANDGDVAGSQNFWVAGASVMNTDPQCLIIDFGDTINVRRVVMVPRTNYGPKDYKIQTATAVSELADCRGEANLGWTTRDTQTGVANGDTITSTFSSVIGARFVRLRATATHARNNPPPPHQTQIREIRAYPN